MENSLPLRVFQGAVGAEGNLGLVFLGFHGPAFSTAWGWKMSDQVRPIANRDGFIQVLVNGHGLAG